MAEERAAVLPEADLNPRQAQARRKGGSRKAAERDPGKAPSNPEVGNPPGGEDEQSDHGNVGVTIGHGLIAHLNKPDDRHKCSQKPEPAHRQEGQAARGSKDAKGNRCQQDSRARHLPGRPMRHARIVNDQAFGPARFLDVTDAGDRGVGEAIGQRPIGKRNHRLGSVLGQNGNPAHGQCQEEKRCLLPYKPAKGRKFSAEV